VHPDRPPALRHAGEDRLILRQIERSPVDIAEHLHARCAEIVEGPLQLGEGGVGVVHGQRGDEAGEAVGVTRDDGRHLVVGEPRQVGTGGRRSHHLDRRIGEGEHLDVAIPAIHHGEAQVEVHEHGDP
jgi:hypothetical protein